MKVHRCDTGCRQIVTSIAVLLPLHFPFRAQRLLNTRSPLLCVRFRVESKGQTLLGDLILISSATFLPNFGQRGVQEYNSNSICHFTQENIKGQCLRDISLSINEADVQDAGIQVFRRDIVYRSRVSGLATRCGRTAAQ